MHFVPIPSFCLLNQLTRFSCSLVYFYSFSLNYCHIFAINAQFPKGTRQSSGRRPQGWDAWRDIYQKRFQIMIQGVTRVWLEKQSIKAEGKVSIRTEPISGVPRTWHVNWQIGKTPKLSGSLHQTHSDWCISHAPNLITNSFNQPVMH